MAQKIQFVYLALEGDVGSWTEQTINGVDVRIQVRWCPGFVEAPFNGEEPNGSIEVGELGAWMCEVQTLREEPIAAQPLRHASDVLAAAQRNPDAPRAKLFAWDVTGESKDPRRDDLRLDRSEVLLAWLPR